MRATLSRFSITSRARRRSSSSWARSRPPQFGRSSRSIRVNSFTCSCRCGNDVLLQQLTLSDFRNYSELEIEPAPGLNVFVGANAQGKSNLLEAIAMLGTGKSFRTAREGDTVRQSSERSVLHGVAATQAGRVELACAIERSSRGTHKSYTVNGTSVRYAGYLGRMRVVTFVPADLHLASGTPGARRAFLNVALSQSEPR